MQRDTVHVLKAIVEGLDDEVVWHDENRRQELANIFPGIFNGCIGVGDVKEYEVEKPKDHAKERMSWSGKKQLIAIRCCPSWTTQDATFLSGFHWGKMIGKF